MVRVDPKTVSSMDPICFLVVVEFKCYVPQLMYTLFLLIIGSRVEFFVFYNGIMNLLE